MTLPFTTDQFFEVFRQYNTSLWPAQIVLVLLALAAVLLVLLKPVRDRWIALSLALFWVWMGIAYHWTFFAEINPAAKGFGVLFILQGSLFLIMGAVRGQLHFARPQGIRGAMGGLLMGYALVAYPLVGMAFGHNYPDTPTFGLPCPTTIFTLGLLLWTDPKPRWWMHAIPWGWSVIGFAAVFKLDVPQDYGLLVAGIASFILAFVPWSAAL